jgi:zinc/manganese transport system ATP-binding protein
VNAIELDRVTLALGGRVVLSGVTLSVRAGEFVGVLGPNGSGKTTLMKALLGLVHPAAGTVRVFGEPPRRGSSSIGYMPQARGHIPDFRISGRDFIGAAVDGERWGLPTSKGKVRARTEAALAAVDALHLAERPIDEMSGGERQRLLLAQAFFGEPRLLLLDEPLIGLDPRNQGRVVDLVRSLARQRGITVLFSAHELNRLLGAIDRVLYLGNGQAALGTVSEVVTAPVLSRLYGADIQVVRVAGNLFVLSNGTDVERGAHDHDRAEDRDREHSPDGGYPHAHL